MFLETNAITLPTWSARSMFDHVYRVFQKKRTPWFILTITLVNMHRF